MARSRKDRNGRRKRKRSEIEENNLIPDDYTVEFLFPDSENITKHTTPFGPLILHEGMIPLYGLKNKRVFFEILSIEEEIAVDDPLESLLQYEKLKNKHPKEPYFHYELANCYLRLNKTDKYIKAVENNFKNFVGYPMIDLAYAEWIFDKNNEATQEEIIQLFKSQLNLHDIYPSFKGFDASSIEIFYTLMTKAYSSKKEYKTARQCADIVALVNSKEAITLQTQIDFDSSPTTRRKVYLSGITALFMIVAIVIGIIWGIVKIFQWIF